MRNAQQTIRLVLSPVFLGLFISGCSILGVQPNAVTFPSPKVVGQNVRDLYQAAGKQPPVKGATATQPATLDPVDFTDAGYRIVFQECNQYFDAIVKTDNGLKMSKGDWVALGSAAAVITTLAKATPKAIGIVAATFGFGSVVLDNLDQYSFAAPYPTQTRGLILKALAAYRQSNEPETAKSVSDAADLIAGYASLCTYSGIAELQAESIAKATPVNATQSGPLFTNTQKAALQPINSLLGLPAGTQLADSDYADLAAIADPATTKQAVLDAIASTFSNAIPSATVHNKIYDPSTHTKQAAVPAIWTILSPLMTSNPQFSAQVTDKEKAAAGVQSIVRKPTVIAIE